ncbi:hypothetical protein BH18ACI3_BH18ACI3_07180 [soil metagenome]
MKPETDSGYPHMCLSETATGAGNEQYPQERSIDKEYLSRRIVIILPLISKNQKRYVVLSTLGSPSGARFLHISFIAQIIRIFHASKTDVRNLPRSI